MYNPEDVKIERINRQITTLIEKSNNNCKEWSKTGKREKLSENVKKFMENRSLKANFKKMPHS